MIRKKIVWHLTVFTVTELLNESIANVGVNFSFSWVDWSRDRRFKNITVITVQKLSSDTLIDAYN